MGIFPTIRKAPKIKGDKKSRSYLQSLDERMRRIENALQPPVKKSKVKAIKRHLTQDNPQYYLGRKRGKYGY